MLLANSLLSLSKRKIFSFTHHSELLQRSFASKPYNMFIVIISVEDYASFVDIFTHSCNLEYCFLYGFLFS